MTLTFFLHKYKIYSSTINNIDLQGNKVINTLNPHSYIIARKDTLFREALEQSEILLPDGEGIVLATRLLLGQRINKIAGADIHLHLLKKVNFIKGKVFYLGSSKETLIKIKNRLRYEYPNIIVDFYSPPYKTEFSKDDNYMMVDAVNKFKPDVLFVGMTAPKQEKWVQFNKNNLNARVICSIGAVFDFYAGTIKRPHPFLIKLKLEWLGRLLKEPKRMWQRNFISTPLFLKDIIIAKIRLKIFKSHNID